MERDVRIKFSPGLILVAAGHAIMLACVFAALHIPPPDERPLVPATLPAPYAQPLGEYRSADAQSRTLPPVNSAARDEIKQQSNCVNCQPQYVVPAQTNSFADQGVAQQWADKYGANLVTERDLQRGGVKVHARLTDGRRWTASGTDRTATYVGANCFLAVINDMKRGVQSAPPATVTPPLPAAPPAIQPIAPVVNPTVPNRTPAPGKTSQRYQVALFVANDAQSQQLLSWFESEPQLANLRANAYFQVYTADNPLYRERYASQVPVEQFPALLFLQPDGGHIHAAGKTMLPSTSAKLLEDLQSSLELAKSAAPQPTGLIRETGYSWDNAINPQMQLQSGDCPDGWCPTDTQRPGLGGRLFDRAQDQRDAMMWFGVQEIGIIILGGLAVVLIIIIAIKRR